MTISAQTEVSEVKHARRAREVRNSLLISLGCRFEILRFHWHSVNLFWTERCVREQVFLQVRQITVTISSRSDSLIHLHNLHRIPTDFFACESAEHQPRSASAAQGCNEAPPSSNRGMRFRRNKYSGRVGH